MADKICAIGCPPGRNLFLFPSKERDQDRRKLWLDFFDMEEPNAKNVYVCERHFSNFQTTSNGLKRGAVPDIPVVCNNGSYLPYKRKIRNLRKNVIVVTPRDPEYIVYRNQTGVFHQNLFDFAKPPLLPLQPKPILQIPVIKSVSCSMSTQTNTRLCGAVQVSEFLDEFRLNCFYCSETYLLENWAKFVKHLKEKHFEHEEAFKKSRYLSEDHDYTPMKSPPSSPITQRVKTHIITEPIIIMPPPPQAEPTFIDLTKDSLTPLSMLSLPPPLPPTAPPQSPPAAPPQSPPAAPPQSSPPLTPKPTTEESNDKSLNITLANKLIKLLDKTVLNPKFRRTQEDNIVVIKKKVVETLQSNFLTKIFEEEAKPTTSTNTSSCNNKKSQMSSSNIPASLKFTRPLYTLNYGQQNVVSIRNAPKVVLKKIIRNRKPTTDDAEIPAQDVEAHEENFEENPVTSYLSQPNLNNRSKSFAKRIARQAIKNITTFENVYQTVKTRPPKVPSSGVFYIKDINSNKVTQMQTSNKTPLSRCLRRATGLESVFTPVSIETLQQNPTELVFEYSPEDVINSLLDNMKHYPVLWEFHCTPFNVEYSSAIKELCKIINTKWSLNLNPLKMHSSVNRILKFYRYMLPCENVDKFSDYFDKCTMFLPSSVEEIPRARCLHCYICYRKDSELRQHLISQHEFQKWPYKCDHCPERFLESDDYELHKRLPHYVEIFKCNQCSKRFNRRGLYNKHMSSHQRTALRILGVKKEKTGNDSNVKHVCNICQKEFKNASGLREHNNLHEEKKFKCDLCPKTFVKKAYLKMHIMYHNKQANFICEVCGKGFIKSSGLSNHIKTHTGEKVTCNICNIKLSASSLPRHRRLVHVAVEGTIESTYRAKNYRYNKLIARRILTRTKESGPRQYDCKICKLPFERLKLLKDHNKLVHDDVERIPCKICRITFRHKHNLKYHYREVHKLHVYQIHKIVEENDDVKKVVTMTREEAEAMYQAELDQIHKYRPTLKVDEPLSTSSAVTAVNYFDQDKIHSGVLQDEIMKAVENIDNHEIKIDDEHSMHDFFNDLLKNP